LSHQTAGVVLTLDMIHIQLILAKDPPALENTDIDLAINEWVILESEHAAQEDGNKMKEVSHRPKPNVDGLNDNEKGKRK